MKRAIINITLVVGTYILPQYAFYAARYDVRIVESIQSGVFIILLMGSSLLLYLN